MRNLIPVKGHLITKWLLKADALINWKLIMIIITCFLRNTVVHYGHFFYILKTFTIFKVVHNIPQCPQIAGCRYNLHTSTSLYLFKKIVIHTFSKNNWNKTFVIFFFNWKKNFCHKHSMHIYYLFVNIKCAFLFCLSVYSSYAFFIYYFIIHL